MELLDRHALARRLINLRRAGAAGEMTVVCGPGWPALLHGVLGLA